MDPDLLSDAIENLKNEGIEPAAIVVVNLFGNPCKVNEIHQIASDRNIPVLEDAAGAFGSKFNNEECGSFGDMSIFSFNGNKIISTGGGGVLNTRSKEDYDLGLYLATQSKEKCNNYLHKNIGFNYRMSNISAAIGNAMIPYLGDLVTDRRRIFEVYKNELSHLMEFQKELPLAFSNRWLTAGLCETSSDRDVLLKSLSERGVESRSVWIPMHKQPIGMEFKCFSNGVSEDLSQRGICLPSGFGLDPKPIIQIIKDSCE
jgi:dTDP-4-amino-4,6-dideoxygalactose transaminase